jgi:hypothetical protein
VRIGEATLENETNVSYLDQPFSLASAIMVMQKSVSSLSTAFDPESGSGPKVATRAAIIRRYSDPPKS